MSSYSVVVIGAENNLTRLREETNCPCYDYKYFLNVPKTVPVSEEAKQNYNRVFSDVISDYKTLQIAERSSIRLFLWQNEFRDLILISKLVFNYLNVICSVNPLFVFFHSTPHEIYSWTLGRVAESMGIPVYKTITTPLPWKSMLSVGLNFPKISPIECIDESNKNLSYVESFFNSNKKRYDEAIPSYEKKRIEARKGHFWSWKKEFLNCFKTDSFVLFVYHFLAMFRKHSLFKFYQSLSEPLLDLNKKYVVVFLHYQPERTSLPEGRFFTQQYHLIKTLSLALPKDYFVYVKEHPSMFVNNLDIRYRDKSFYKDIASLSNVSIVNIGVDSFTLIDKSICIATITGTVGIQSFIRGKSVLCFGDASYVGFKHCYSINNVIDIRYAIQTIIANDCETVTNDFYQYLKEIDSHSFTGVPKGDIGDYYDDEYRLNSGGKVMRYLLLDNLDATQ